METNAEEISRLHREIGERQARLQFLVLGDPRIGVTFEPKDELGDAIRAVSGPR